MAIREISLGRDPLTNIDEGIVSLGLGKNMVESMRCWIEAFQIATKEDDGWEMSEVGDLVFNPDSGLDPFLEDHSSNWLLHWLISTNCKTGFTRNVETTLGGFSPQLSPTQEQQGRRSSR